MQYLELFYTASHACGGRQEGHPVVKTRLQYSSSTLLKKECYEAFRTINRLLHYIYNVICDKLYSLVRTINCLLHYIYNVICDKLYSIVLRYQCAIIIQHFIVFAYPEDVLCYV